MYLETLGIAGGSTAVRRKRCEGTEQPGRGGGDEGGVLKVGNMGGAGIEFLFVGDLCSSSSYDVIGRLFFPGLPTFCNK